MWSRWFDRAWWLFWSAVKHSWRCLQQQSNKQVPPFERLVALIQLAHSHRPLSFSSLLVLLVASASSVAFCIFPPLVALSGSCIVGRFLKVQQGSGTRGSHCEAFGTRALSHLAQHYQTRRIHCTRSVLAQDETPFPFAAPSEQSFVA